MVAPHKLYKVIPGSSVQDEDGNWITTKPSKEYVCDCFLHDLTIKERVGLNGVGIKATHYVNMMRRDDLEYGLEVEIYEGDELRGKGSIVDIKKSTKIRRTVIYI